MCAAFDEWFGESRVVDKQGRALTVFHGSRSPWISSFDLGMEGTGVVNTQSKRYGAIWFTSSEKNAHFYTDLRPKKTAVDLIVYGRPEAFYVNVEDRNGAPIFQTGPYATEDAAVEAGRVEMDRYNRELRRQTFVVPVYLAIHNPLILESAIPREKEFEAARSAGHDGIWARDVVDGCAASDCFVAFSPSQVKSVRNQGTWSRTDANIRN
jgi:hypothetical protein